MANFRESEVWSEVGPKSTPVIIFSLITAAFMAGVGANVVWENTLTAWFLFGLGSVTQYAVATAALELGVKWADDN